MRQGGARAPRVSGDSAPSFRLTRGHRWVGRTKEGKSREPEEGMPHPEGALIQTKEVDCIVSSLLQNFMQTRDRISGH